jgi:hypothetical protein
MLLTTTGEEAEPLESSVLLDSLFPTLYSPRAEEILIVELDHGGQGQSADFRPVLPLRFRW